MFLLYINDICESSNIFKFFLFADDTTLFFSGNRDDNTEEIINAELRKVSHWLAANKLSLNIKKSNLLHFCIGKKSRIDIRINDIPIEEKQVTKYLGVLIDNKLSWKQHIEHIKIKIAKGIGVISKVRNYTSKKCLLNLFYAFVQSHIEYNILNWTCTRTSFLVPIELQLKKAVRVISFKNRLDHTTPLFISNKILPLRELIKLKQGAFLWKIKNGYISSPVSNYFSLSNHNNMRFNQSAPRNELQKNYIEYSGVKYWNSLPVKLRAVSTLNCFTGKLKKILLSNL